MLLILASAGPAWAQSSTQAAEKKQPSNYDKIWGRVTNWYDNKENPVVQRVVFTGRYHQDFASVDADQGEIEEWNVRRVRFGPRITFFRNYLFTPKSRSIRRSRILFYVRLTDAYVAWSRNPTLTLPSASTACRSRKRARPRPGSC